MKTIDELLKLAEEFKNTCIEITHHSKSTKMEDIDSISTHPALNRICKIRALDKDSICSHCYAHKLAKLRPGLSDRLARNTGRLTNDLISDANICKFKTEYGRIEAFGDTDSPIQAKNYLKVIYANPNTQFGIWSKNLTHWKEAFEELGKPTNCTFVASSPKLNERLEIHDSYKWFVDHVFTVWSKGHDSNCAGIKCKECLKCYKKNDEYFIDEIVR